MTILSVYTYVNGDFMKKIKLLHIYQIAFLFLSAPLLFASENVDLGSRSNIKPVDVPMVNSTNTDMDVTTAIVDQPHINTKSVNVDMDLVKTKYTGRPDSRFFTEAPDEILMFLLSFLDIRSAAMATSVNRNLWRLRQDRKFLYLRNTPYLGTLLLARFDGSGPDITESIDKTFQCSDKPLLRQRLKRLGDGLNYRWGRGQDSEAMVRNYKVRVGCLKIAGMLGDLTAPHLLVALRESVESCLVATSGCHYATDEDRMLAISTLYRQYRYLNEEGRRTTTPDVVAYCEARERAAA